jgi:hypothetical protein
MAATQYSPLPGGLEDIEDPVTYEEASALLAQTGHPAAVSTIRHWVQDDGIATVRARQGGKMKRFVSYTDILDAHFKRTAVKLRASSDWP